MADAPNWKPAAFEVDIEPWFEVKLVNGDRIMIRTIVTGVFQQIDNDGNVVRDDLGRVVYAALTQQITNVIPGGGNGQKAN